MPNSPSASFIPKQGPIKRSRQTASRQVHIFTIISYILFVATLIATIGIYLFNRHLQNQLNVQVEKLNGLIGSFNESDMKMVREFNVRLQQAENRLSHSVALSSVFSALETATAQTVEIEELKIERKDDQNFVLAAKLATGSFDSSLFQRGVLESNDIVESVTVSDVNLGQEEAAGGVSFLATIVVPLEEVPYEPQVLTIPEAVSSATTTTETTLNSSASSTPESNL